MISLIPRRHHGDQRMYITFRIAGQAVFITRFTEYQVPLNHRYALSVADHGGLPAYYYSTVPCRLNGGEPMPVPGGMRHRSRHHQDPRRVHHDRVPFPRNRSRGLHGYYTSHSAKRDQRIYVSWRLLLLCVSGFITHTRGDGG